MAAISAVFTIGCVATLRGEDENRSFDLSIDMFPQNGCLWVHGVGQDGVPAFTRDSIENLPRSSQRRQPAATNRRQCRQTNPPCGAHRLSITHI
jgi:hypothetical protein